MDDFWLRVREKANPKKISPRTSRATSARTRNVIGPRSYVQDASVSTAVSHCNRRRQFFRSLERHQELLIALPISTGDSFPYIVPVESKK